MHATLYPEDYGFFYGTFGDDDWLEYCDIHSPSKIRVGHHKSDCTIEGQIPGDKLQSALVYILGHSWVDNNLHLRRLVPVRHPYIKTLWADNVSMAWGQKFTDPNLTPDDIDTLPYAKYDKFHMVVNFTQYPYRILSDIDIDYADYNGQSIINSWVNSGASPTTLTPATTAQELRRYTNQFPKPYIDLLRLPSGTLKFDAPGVTLTDLNGKSVSIDNKAISQGDVRIRSQKSLIKLSHYQIPYDFVCTNAGEPIKLMSAIGRCNSDWFLGQAPETILLDDVDIIGGEVYSDPVSGTTDMEYRKLDLLYCFRKFDPERGVPSNPRRGWRLAAAFNGKWYPTKNSLGGTVEPKTAPFNDLFLHWSINLAAFQT